MTATNDRGAAPPSICVVGTGQAAAHHVGVLSTVAPQASLGVVSRDAARASVFAQEHGIVAAHGSVDEAIDTGYDIVVVATPPRDHAATIARLLDADVHLVVEKPVVDHLDELAALWDALVAHPRVVVVAENQHFAPQHQQLAAVLADGSLGRPQLVQVTRMIRSPLRTWRADPDQMRGALHEAGIHWVRRLLALTDLLASQEGVEPGVDLLGVFAAEPATRVTETPGDETIVALGRHRSGLVSQLVHSWSVPHRTGAFDLSKVVCEHGAIYFDVRGRGGVVFRGSRPRPSSLLPPVRTDRNGYEAMWRHVLDCVTRGQAPSLSLDTVWRDLAYVDAAYRSTRSHAEEAPRAVPEAAAPRPRLVATRPSLSPAELDSFEETGFAGPFPLLEPDDFDEIVGDFLDTIELVGWYKGLHEFDSAATRAALRPEVVGRVASILGDDLLLWATQVMTKPPGADHRWHVDIETMAWKSLNVWVAMHNVTPNSTIAFIPGSHRYGPACQDLARSEPIDLGDAADVCRVARRFDPDAEVQTVLLDPGEFVVFDGHLWHGSVNTTGQRRTALLTQYSPPTCDIRMPATFEEPIEWKAEKPACVLASGVDDVGINRLVDPAPMRRVELHRRLIRRLRHR